MQFLFTSLPWMAPPSAVLEWLVIGATVVSVTLWIRGEKRQRG
jgi:hypothetical protein